MEDLKEEKDNFESKIASMASSHASALSGLKAQLKSQEEAAKTERERARQDSEAWRTQMANLEEEVREAQVVVVWEVELFRFASLL